MPARRRRGEEETWRPGEEEIREVSHSMKRVESSDLTSSETVASGWGAW